MTVSGSRPDPSLTERERRLDEAIAEYLVAAESGRAPDRRKFLAQYPDLAEDLAAFFQDEECVRGLAGTVPMSGKDGSRRTPSGALIAGELDLLGVGGEFGDFELLEEIASGGMGIVFRARQKSLNRVVALKTIRPSAFRAGDDAAQRFRLEAEAVARLDHPGIVPIFEMGELGGYPFLCLKLIEGGDLDRHRERFRNDPAAAAQMTAEVSRAVHYAHQRGILHRDLKPSNILLDEHGRPHVTDFGLARCLEEDSCLTQTGQIVGTPSYMAPEQVSGPRSALTTAADVYGLGAVLYTLLAGRPPFKGDSVYETLRQVREQEPVAPGTLSAGVDRDLEAICLKCLEKDPRGRYPSAEALAVDLERWLAGEPIVARPAGRAERAWRWYRRNRLIANVSVGVALLIVAFAAVAGIAAVGYYLEAGRAVLAVDAETKAKNLAKAQAEAFRENLVRLAVAGGIRVMDQGDTTGALPWFAEALMYDKDDENAAAAHRLRLGILLGQCPTLDGIFSDGRPITWATFDPTGRRVATASADGIARVWEVATGEAVTPELVHDGPVNRAEFRGDGGRLVTASDDGSVRVWDLDGKRPATDPALRLEHGAPVNFVHFTFDGRRVISGGADGTLRLWIAANGTPAGPTQRIGTPLVDLVQSTDGRTLATASEDGSSQLWRLDGRGLHAVGALAPSRVRRVALSPDGTKLATASAVGMARVWDARTGAPITPPLTHGHWISQTEFSPDGKWLATASEDGTARVWDARTGRPIGSGSATISHVAGVNEVSFSPDGARLVTAGLDGTARIWDVDSRLPLSPPFFHGGSLRRARFSPDGYHLLTVGSDSTARLWDVSRMGGSALEIEDPTGVGYAAFDPTGGRIATAGNGGAALVWNAETGEAVSQPMRHRRTIVRVAFSTDGQRVATASKDGMARVWDAGTGRPVTYALAHDGPVRDVRFSRDGTRLATASADGRARLWDVATSKNAVPPMEHGKAVNAVAFSPDGRWLATASDDGTARIWEVTSGQPARTPLEHGAPVTCVDFRPDGRALLTACSDENFTELQAQQWNLETGKPLGVAMKHRDGVLWAVYSPDGRRIATASEDRTARVWDSFGEPVIGPLTHQHQVLKVAFSPDGRRLASCSLDGTARVWDVATGEPLSPPLLHRDHTRVGSVAFSPDDGRLLTAGMDGMARVWELLRDERPADLLVLNAQALAGRRLYQAGAVFHTGAEIPLTASELQDAWRRLRDSDPTGRQAGSQSAIRSRIAWHRREARRLELGHQGTAAAWHLSRLHELQPGDASLDARLAAAYEMAADWEGLNRSASRAIAGGSSDVEVGIRRGWARLYLGWPADAATDFRHALKQEPRSAAIRLGLFAATAEMDNPEEADALWRDVMNDHDESRPERWADVAAHLARLARARSESWGFCRASGHAQLRAGSAEQSEADYNRALQIKPNDAWSYLGRGLARKKLGRLDGALVDLARAVELEPRMAASWRLRGEIHGVRRQWDEAARDFAHWAEVGGEPSALFWYDHAALRLQVRDHDGYRRTCMAMWECFGRSDDPAVAGYVARACVLGPDPGIPTEKVIDLARQGVQVHPRSGWDLSTLGAALLRAGRFKDGLAQLDEAAKVEPGWIGIPLIEALRDMALRGRAGHEPPTAWTTADRKAEGRSSVDFSKIIGRMLKAKAPWNLGLEAELLVREHDEGRSGPQAKPGP